MVNQQQETVLERIMRFEPQAAVILDAIEDKEAMTADLDRIFDFLHSHELRPGDNKFSHINYGGFAKAWYSTISGRYSFDQDSLPMLYSSMIKLCKYGVPLQLVECKEGRLVIFPLHFDIDVKLSSDAADPTAIEAEILDEAEGFRFFRILAKLVELVYPNVGEVVVFSASGTSREIPNLISELEVSPPTKKVSFRVVFPDIVVDKERATLLWQHVTSRLTALSSEESSVPYIRTLLKRLRQLSPINESFSRVIDETVVRCKHGVRMPFSDKTERGRSAGRVMKPLIALRGEAGERDGKIASMTVSRRPPSDDNDAELISWLELGALTTPLLRHASLTEWNRPNVRSTARVTKTGAGGSSLALTKLTTADAARAAERAAARRRTGPDAKENSEPVTARYSWPDGSVTDFKKKLKAGYDRKFEERPDGSVVWKNPKKRNCQIVFNESTKLIESTAPNRDTLDFLARIMADFTGLAVVTGAAPRVAPELKKYKVMHAFKAEGDGEIDVEEGEILVALSVEENQWANVRKENGVEGYVPSEFIQPLE